MWTKRYSVKLFILVIFLTFLSFLSFMLHSWALLLKGDFCNNFSKGMTPEEKIYTALEWANNQSKLTFEHTNSNGYKYLSSAGNIPYDSPEEILKQQPDCCFLTARDGVSPFRLEGYDEGMVHIEYIGRKKTKSNYQKMPVKMYGNLNNCF